MLQPVLSQLNIYPLKSTCGIPLKKSSIFQRGLENDRRWMVVDDFGQFVTQRTNPSMALIRTEIVRQTLTLNAPQMSELILPLSPTEGKSQEVEVWGDHCEAWSTNPQSRLWISEYLNKGCNIVFMPDHSIRIVDPNYAPTKNLVSFSDGYPFLLISESSLSHLNNLLPKSITMKRFRPNLVVKNTKPYEEDNWQKIKIGECEFQIVKPCSRCSLITVDPATGESSGKEPLKTLSSYRKQNGKVVFGQNLIADKIGKLEVGMTVDIVSKSLTKT